MKTLIYCSSLIMATILFISRCNTDSKENIYFYIDKIFINQYKSDSLNNIRPKVLPIIYYHISAVNRSKETKIIEINTYGENDINNKLKLYVVYNHDFRKDTLVITDFESFKSFELEANDTTRFTLNAYMPPFYEKHQSNMNVKDLMYQIAKSGTMYYKGTSNNSSNNYFEFKKSNDFHIEFRDPKIISID